MDILRLIFTLLALGIAVWAIAKKYYAPMTLILVSLIIMFIFTAVTKTSVLGDKTAGNMYIDIFEFVASKFASAFASNGIVLIPIFGYATFMTKLNASKLLAALAIKPLKKIGHPYLFGIPLVLLIGAVLRLAIGSQTGLNALFLVCIYPVLIACGLSKYSAAACIILSTTFDYGPGDSPTNLIFGNVVGGNVTNFFIDYQLKIYPFAILMCMILAVLVNYRADKKLGAFNEESVEELNVTELGLPVYYALFPMLPLVLWLCSV